MTRRKKNLVIKIHQRMEELDSVRIIISDFLKENCVSEENILRTELSIYEVLANIIDHSSPDFKDREIIVECRILKERIKTVISNYGKEFDIRKADLPDISNHFKSGKKRGLGIYFIRTLMDNIDYSYKEHLNKLILTKNI
ncbi:MAG: ATP-binding protein [Spirochaetes bacterium]|jgi:serine/threonine-protein kinase RsbW|nr:ATP-binding protein [Spirochaetota bacterium]